MDTTNTILSPTNKIDVEEVPELKTNREIQFNNILKTVSALKTQLSAFQHQIKVLEKSVNKEIKHLRKEAAKNKNKGNRQPSGFAKPVKISKELCEFLNKPEGTEAARTEVTKYLSQYIKDKGLQSSKNKKTIEPNDELKALLDITDPDDELNYFNLQKRMNKHFYKKKDEIEVSAIN